jgi:hypothetical protein
MKSPDELADAARQATSLAGAAASRCTGHLADLIAHGIDAVVSGLLTVAASIEAARRDIREWRARIEGEQTPEP